jgi:hypothetical protein
LAAPFILSINGRRQRYGGGSARLKDTGNRGWQILGVFDLWHGEAHWAELKNLDRAAKMHWILTTSLLFAGGLDELPMQSSTSQFGVGHVKGDGGTTCTTRTTNIIATEDRSDSVDLRFVVVTAALRRGRRAIVPEDISSARHALVIGSPVDRCGKIIVFAEEAGVLVRPASIMLW